MQRKIKKTGMVLLSSLAMVSLGLAGCSSSDKGATSESNEKVEITYLHRLPDGDGMVKVEDVIKKWNAAHPNIQVKSIKFPGKADEMIKKLETDVKAGTAPCLAQLGYAEVPEMFVKNLLEDVTKEADKYKDKFGAGYISQMTVAGKTVGLPQDSGPLVYFYNATEFTKLGLKVPTTSAELLEVAKQAASKGKYALDFEADEAQNLFSGLSAAAGDTWYSVEGKKWVVKANGEGSRVVAKFWQDALDAKATLTLNRWSDEYTASLGSKAEKQLIGNIGAAWEAGFMLNNVDTAGQWKVVALPDFGKDMTGPDGGSGVAVMKGCKYPVQAMKFNAWFNTQIEALASQGLVIAAKGVPATPEAVKKAFGGQDVFADLAKFNEKMNPNFPYIPGFSGVKAGMSKAAEAAANGNGKVMTIFDSAQESSIKILKELQLPVVE